MMNSSILNVTLKEWQMANRTTIEKRINVFFMSVEELDAGWLVLRLGESVVARAFPFLNVLLFSANFFNDVIMRQFRNVKTHNGRNDVTVRLATMMYQNT